MATKEKPGYIKASELYRTTDYCPECDGARPFRFEEWLEPQNADTSRFLASCDDCGMFQHYSVEVSPE
jgi:hypothetical protein